MEKGACFIKAVLHVLNESEQREIICNNLRLIPSDEVQTVFGLSPSLFSQPCRFRRAVKSASFPPGEAERASANSPWIFQLVFCVPRLTPPARCAVLSFALSGCTPSRTATPAKPFRGGWQEVNRIRWRGGCFPGFCRWSRRRRCPGRGTGPGAGRARRRPRNSRRARG